ncbi:MAG: hypothetical protein MUP26_06465, partial [Desulfobulbaceae bacterium]|nr:hypothetical protein [Desulfobulbaceae bacterium]
KPLGRDRNFPGGTLPDVFRYLLFRLWTVNTMEASDNAKGILIVGSQDVRIGYEVGKLLRCVHHSLLL